ncbi:MAG TPA: hypothetical protein PK536_08450 [Ignavibacteria bacterium]|nr:hypothetical protein [Bacteroidota bacterium]HRI85463.1 hypothetical protein [Ignavibacteria bacterium]HRJ98971.1 hypothetical protein [Ignavibacteria bacterium]
MEETLQISQIIVNIIIVVLFTVIIFFLVKISKLFLVISEKINSIADDSKELKPKIIATFEKIESLADSVTEISGKVNDNMDVLGSVVDNVKDSTERVLNLQKKVMDEIEPPVLDTVSTISAVSVGVKTFFNALKSRNNNSDH